MKVSESGLNSNSNRVECRSLCSILCCVASGSSSSAVSGGLCMFFISQASFDIKSRHASRSSLGRISRNKFVADPTNLPKGGSVFQSNSFQAHIPVFGSPLETCPHWKEVHYKQGERL
jgi:hypothetical protein